VEQWCGSVHGARTGGSPIYGFLEPPLYNQRYAQGFGTVYTAVYRPRRQELTYAWPGESFTRTFDSPDENITVSLHEG
jgi:hypothetical protein